MGLGLVFTQEPTCNISYSDFRYELSNFSLKYTFSGVLVWVQDQVHGLGHKELDLVFIKEPTHKISYS